MIIHVSRHDMMPHHGILLWLPYYESVGSESKFLGTHSARSGLFSLPVEVACKFPVSFAFPPRTGLCEDAHGS